MCASKTGQNAGITQASTPTQSVALEMLFNEYLLPVIHRLPASTAVKKALDSEDVLLLINEHLHELSHVFCKYAETKFNKSDIDGSRDSAIMNLQQFILFATDYGFVGPSTSIKILKKNGDCEGGVNNDINLKDVRQVFSASQHDTAMNDVENDLEDDTHKETMVFPEYIEAVIRLGFVKYSLPGESHDKDHYECVRRAVMKIISSDK